MSLPPHWLHIYQKPAQGNAFVKRYSALNYEHKINVLGWFDTASCELSVTQAEAELIYENYVGNRVAVYVDNPSEPIWEGYIPTIIYTAGGLEFRRTMDSMANSVYLNHAKNVAGVTTTVISAAADVTASQNIYGIKEVGVKGRAHRTGSTADSIDLLRNRKVNEVAYPQVSVTKKSGGNNYIKMEMRGLWDTLGWESVQQNRAYDVTPSISMEVRYLPGMLNGNTFFDNTDFTELDTPGVNVQTSQDLRTGETGRDYLEQIAELGDGVDLWIVGMTPTRATGLRRLYYRKANKTVEYTALTRDGLRIRNKSGALVRPWAVTPDKTIRISDILVGWNAIGSDPRETYIKAISYKQNSNTVTWVGEDDVTMEGILGLFRRQKDFRAVFGQPVGTATFS
jgi:hypothetical protein